MGKKRYIEKNRIAGTLPGQRKSNNRAKVTLPEYVFEQKCYRKWRDHMSVARTIRNETRAISLKSTDLLNGEHLVYKLKVMGSQGIFSIVDEKSRILLKSTDFPVPQAEYSRVWPASPQDIPPEKDLIYTLVVSFSKATKYTYSIEHHKADGSVPTTLKSIDFESKNVTDSDYNTLRVLLG